MRALVTYATPFALFLAAPIIVHFVLVNVGVDPLIAKGWLYTLWMLGLLGYTGLLCSPTREVEPRRRIIEIRVVAAAGVAYAAYQVASTIAGNWSTDQPIQSLSPHILILFLALSVLLNPSTGLNIDESATDSD